MNKVLLFIYLAYSLAYTQESKIEYVDLNHSVEFNEKNKNVVSKIAIELQNFIDTKSSDFWLDKNDIIDGKNEFFRNLNFYQILDLSPTIISIYPIKGEYNHYIVKIGFLGISGDKHFLGSIYNLVAIFVEDEVKFKNILTMNLKKMKSKEIDDVTFYYDHELEFNDFEAQQFIDYNKRLARFFDRDPVSFTFIAKNSYDDCMKTLGYDFEGNMFFENDNGSISYPSANLILSGNGMFSNIHELVHIYTYKKNLYRNSILDEGLAVFFGGSKGFDLKYHSKVLKEHLKDNRIDIYHKLFFGNYVIDENTSLKYTLGGIICKILLEKGNKELFFEVFNSSTSNDELIKNLEKVLNINETNFNDYFYEYLDF